jgi:hypothetical protein
MMRSTRPIGAIRPLPRRLMLRGLFGGTAVAIGLPPLEAMLDGNGTAFAGGAPLPKFFGLFFWGNGVKLDRWVPQAAGTGQAWSLSPALAPLAQVKSHLSVVTGTNLPPNNGHLPGTAYTLTGQPFVKIGTRDSGENIGDVAGPSIDQIVAKALGRGDPLQSLEVGICPRVQDQAGPLGQYLSHAGRGNPNPPFYDPARVFAKLFQGASPAGAGDPRAALAPSVLDVVREDLAALKVRVGAADKRRLDQHLEGIFAIEQRLKTLPASPTSGCQPPPTPATIGDAGSDEGKLIRVNRLMTDLVAKALVCQRTRVFSILFSTLQDRTRYLWLKAPAPSHGMTHNEGGGQPIVHQSTVWVMTRFAELLARLRDEPLGAGSVLDRCCILATSDVAEGLTHSCKNHPVLIAGRAGGALRGDTHYRSTTGETSLKAHLTALRAMGLAADGFGTGAARATETIRALET